MRQNRESKGTGRCAFFNSPTCLKAVTGMASSLSASPIELLRRTGTRLVLVATGGGSEAIPLLLTEPGASDVVLEAVVPYARPAIDHLLGGPQESYCSGRTARRLAVAAWQRAMDLEAPVEEAVGLAVTASLRSRQTKRGAHRVHVAVHHLSGTSTATLTLKKGSRSRSEEERLAAMLSLDLLLETMAAEPVPAWRAELDALLLDDEHVVRETCRPPAAWQQLFTGSAAAVPKNFTANATLSPEFCMPTSMARVRQVIASCPSRRGTR